jgi:hypothetical protein
MPRILRSPALVDPCCTFNSSVQVPAWGAVRPQDGCPTSASTTCATLLLSKGVNPKFVQELLGHAGIKLTLGTYSHFPRSMGIRRPLPWRALSAEVARVNLPNKTLPKVLF